MIHGISDQVDKMVQTIVLPKARPVDIDTAVSKSQMQPPAPEKVKVNAESAPKPEIDPKALKELIGEINQEAARLNYRLSLSIDHDTNRVLIKFKDPESGEVIRQIPPEVVLEIAKRFDELKGALFDSQG